ncbi:MAG TPA: glycosyltransferase, partial [Patescibacteria group bacterium]|nr:glycosyltransferase [Patescibacteria group bacterium]
MKRVAMISVHECPLASSEGKERGGINVYTFELSKALARLGWQVDAFTRIQDDVNPRIVAVNENFRVIHLPNGPHTRLSKKDILANIPEFTKALAPYITRYDVIHAQYYLSGVVANQFPTPWVMTFHTLGLMKQLVARGSIEDPEERISLERKLASNAYTIITASDAGREYLAAMYDAKPENMVTIPPGVDTTLFHPIDKATAKRHIHADPNHRVVLAVGRIDPVKGFDVLLVALKMLIKKNPDLTDR